jgi:chemotaxis protein methyltransferase CheR
VKTAVRSADDLDYMIFIKRMAEQAGVDLRAYKRRQMERRLRSLAHQHGASSLRQFAHMLDAQPELLEEFRRRMTINVSEVFRDLDRFEELRRTVLPDILQQTERPKVWSAGCSYGAEAYSLAVLLEEAGVSGQASPVLGTDIDEEMLARARAGIFSEADMKCVSRARRSRFFSREGDKFRVSPEIRARVHLRRHDLVSDPFDRGHHLILCRNVVIYFTDEAKESLYCKFYDSLASGGVLFIGSTERIFQAREIGYESIGPFFYRKPTGSGE